MSSYSGGRLTRQSSQDVTLVNVRSIRTLLTMPLMARLHGKILTFTSNYTHEPVSFKPLVFGPEEWLWYENSSRLDNFIRGGGRIYDADGQRTNF